MVDCSVVISTYNEEKSIERSLMSVRWADEIIVVDNNSTDDTVNIARKYTTKIYHQRNNIMLNINKNFGFTKASKTWILSLDSDEVVDPELAEEIKTMIKKTENRSNTIGSVLGYWIPRKNIIFGKWIQHGLWWPDKQLRLFIKGKGKFPCKHVHEYIHIDGQTKEFQHSFTHYNYDTISEFIQKLDTIYTVNEVSKLINSKYQFAWYDAIRFPMSDFVKIYFAQEGYKDGLHGLVLSILQSFYSFIVFCKLWEKYKFTDIPVQLSNVSKELQLSQKEINYWKLTSQKRQTDNAIEKIWLTVLRKYVS